MVELGDAAHVQWTTAGCLYPLAQQSEGGYAASSLQGDELLLLKGLQSFTLLCRKPPVWDVHPYASVLGDVDPAPTGSKLKAGLDQFGMPFRRGERYSTGGPLESVPSLSVG